MDKHEGINKHGQIKNADRMNKYEHETVTKALHGQRFPMPPY